MDLYCKVDGVLLKRPNEFKVEHYKLTKAGRVASGKMTIDLVAKKLKFILKYDVLNSNEVKTILDACDGTNMFMTFEYIDNNEVKTATVYFGDYTRTLIRTGSTWYWKDAEVHLIEQ